jgi:hypothetical protein
MNLSLRKAQRVKSKLKIGLTAPSGAGKTFSALLLASGLCKGKWDKVAIIDTEGSGDKYADHSMLGPFNVIDMNENSSHKDRFAPGAFVNALNVCIDAGMECVIIDTATHEWQWCLEYYDSLGGKMHHWKDVTPLHNKFLKSIVQSKVHVIVCTRRKADYAIDQEKGKKATVQKVGMKSEIREGFEYEMDLVFGLNHNHLAMVEKDRTSLFAGNPGFVITADTGKKLLDWSESGCEPAEPVFDSRNTIHERRLKELMFGCEIDGSKYDSIAFELEGVFAKEIKSKLEKIKIRLDEESNGLCE